MNMKHLIRKQVIWLQLDAGQPAFTIQQVARDYYYREILPALEQLFDELSMKNEVVYIEKLEINLGDLGWKNDRFILDRKGIYRILVQSFGKAMAQSAGKAESTVPVVYLTPEENACLQWMYYLENGVLPWQVHALDEIWLSQVLHQLAIDHVSIENTRRKILRDPVFLERLAREHNEIFLQQFAEVITAKAQPGLALLIKTIAKKTDPTGQETLYLEKQLWGQALLHFSSGKTSIAEENLVTVLNENIQETIDNDNRITKEEALFCRYAGLVLLHPFFKHLFNRLGLLNEEKFRDEMARAKAAVLLHYVATGKTEVRDYDLVIPKIFCGIPLQQLLPLPAYDLTGTEKQEAQDMILAAIDQWEIMRNTSVEGLRESFLERDGRLTIKERGYEFRIETKGIDVLLDQLPWNLSLVQLPWLSRLIYVEWR